MKAARIIFALAALSIASAASATPGIDVWPTSPQPGEAVFVTIEPYYGLTSGSCTWMKKKYDLVATEEGLQAVLPVPADAKPGGYHVYVTYQRAPDGGETRPFLIEVRPRKFGVQHLRLPKAQEAKYDASVTKREYALIGAALDRETEELHWKRNFIMPVKGRISTQYGLQRYVNGRFSYRHKGVDIAAPMGTPVKAAADGVVSLADDSFVLHGKTIIIDHGGGLSSLYLHLSRIDVSAGEQIKQGQVIGKVGATGAATGPHLHYGVYVHHEAMDPFYWVKALDSGAEQ
jgi:murein DD-endopeptidase MepM/ murein hydrolase activator NlpD